MTLPEKLSEIEQQFNYWVGIYERKELNTNSVRIVAEAICKSVLLFKQGEAAGTAIILGKDPLIPKHRRSRAGYAISFAELISSLKQLDIFKEKKSIEHHFELIRDRANSGSHSSNSSKDKVKPEDLDVCNDNIKALLKWLFAEVLKTTLPGVIQNGFEGRQDLQLLSLHDEKWHEFEIACQGFDKRKFQYIFVSPENLSDDQYTVQQFASLPWRLVIDFNRKTDEEENGLLYNFNLDIGVGYKKSYTVEDKIGFEPDFPHYWFLANGQGSIPEITDFKLWRNKYQKFLAEQLYTEFNKGSRIKSRIVVLFNIAPLYAEQIINSFNWIDEENLKFILCSENENYENIFEKTENVQLINISAIEIANGIKNHFHPNTSQTTSSQILIPHYRDEKKVTTPINITQDHYDYLHNLGIEIVFRGIEQSIPSDDENKFFKGNTITWRDLAEQKDITRNTLDSIKKRLEAKLAENRLDEVELVHEAGAGGTTLSRRIAFEFSQDYPTIVLRKYIRKKTIDGLRILYDQYTKGSLPLLIIIESFEVKDSHLLFKDLSNAKKNATILIVSRGLIQKAVNKKFVLKAQLEGKEILAFENSYINLCPEKKELLRALPKTYEDHPKYISPVLYALTAFGKNYDGMESYIAKCLEGITLEQKKVTGFICLIYYYTQKAVPVELFSTLFNVDRSKSDLLEILGKENPLLELLHQESDEEDYYNIWRPRYFILGEEAMQTIISGGAEHKSNWKSHLASWLIDLIKSISDSMPYLDNETAQIFDSLFIERSYNDDDLLNKEFTKAIQDLRSADDGVAIFKALTNAYPNEAHYHGHFARYLYNDKIGIRDYDNAIIEANASLDLYKENSSLLHTLGMCYKEKSENLIYTYAAQGLSPEEAEEEIKNLTEAACDTFDRCIEADPDNIYGHVAQIRLILKTLEFAYKAYHEISKEIFISNPINSWYAEKLDKVSVLLEEASFVIEQSKKLENRERINKSAEFIKDCEGIFYKTLGQHVKAKSMFEDLIKNTPKNYDYMRPHYRRMFIMCLLASKSEKSKDLFHAWLNVSPSELNQSVQYLEENIFEDPNNTQNIRLWLQAIRHLHNPPEIISCITKISAWTQVLKQNENSLLEGYYYLYVLNAIKAIADGNTFDPTTVKIVKEVQEKMKPHIRNEKFCYEWYGRGVGIQQMVNHQKLGDFTADFFEKNKHILVEVTGRIKNVPSSQQGSIILDCGLEAFFVPNVGGFTERNVNDRIKCFIGFRYDQIQAWSVILQTTIRNQTIRKQEKDELNSLIDSEEFEEKIVSNYIPQVAIVDKVDLPKLTGTKVVGKVILDKPQTNQKYEETMPKKNKIYQGLIKVLNNNSGYLTVFGFDRDVAFNAVHCRDINFKDLALGDKVSIKINFQQNSPKLDFSKRNYIALDVQKSIL